MGPTVIIEVKSGIGIAVSAQVPPEQGEDRKTMQILGYAVAVAVSNGIGHANEVVLSAQLDQQPLSEMAIMVLFGLALLGVSAIIRGRTRT